MNIVINIINRRRKPAGNIFIIKQNSHIEKQRYNDEFLINNSLKFCKMPRALLVNPCRLQSGNLLGGTYAALTVTAAGIRSGG